MAAKRCSRQNIFSITHYQLPPIQTRANRGESPTQHPLTDRLSSPLVCNLYPIKLYRVWRRHRHVMLLEKNVRGEVFTLSGFSKTACLMGNLQRVKVQPKCSKLMKRHVIQNTLLKSWSYKLKIFLYCEESAQ